MKLFTFLAALCLCSCAYNIGHANRTLPGGHKTVFVNMFENTSQEVGAEGLFTQALINQLQRSGFITVTDKNAAEIIIDGTILDVLNSGGASFSTFYKTKHPTPTDSTSAAQAYTASMFTEYLLSVSANIQAKRTRDNKVIWQTFLNNQENYQGPKLRKDGLRSSNALYNQSAKKQTMKLIAKDMMREAFDRLTENF